MGGPAGPIFVDQPPLLNRLLLVAHWDRRSLVGEVETGASLVCLFGLFLHFVLSAPLLDANGFSYTDVGGPPWQKVHPGSLFIIASFGVLLMAGGNPIERLFRVVANSPAFCLALAINVLVSVWVVVRSGVGGIGTMIDTHWTPVLAAIVLSYAPRWLCRRALFGFLFLCVLNSCIGIGESLFQKRLFTFKADWGVLHEPQFRASALIGHPLANAQLTSIAIFILLSTRISSAIKISVTALFFISLVAFGGRIALAFSVVGFLVWGLGAVAKAVRSGHLTVLHIFLIALCVLAVPIVLLVSLDASIHTTMGERLRDSSLDDSSVRSRFVALDVIDRMTPDELWFGVSLQRELDIAHSLPSAQLGADIENPWILMLMSLGIVGFVIWLCGLAIFVVRLARRAPLALQLAVLSYFTVGSTSNSFGRKDSVFCLMAGAVMCASVAGARPGRLPRRALAGQVPRSSVLGAREN